MKGIVALAGVSVICAWLAIRFRRQRRAHTAMLLLGVACFIVAALTHVFEAFSVLPALGWGQPHSAGHYIDLGAAILGIALVLTGLLLQFLDRH